MHPKDIDIIAYSYDLPEEKIAKFPLPDRSSSRLLVYRHGKIKDDGFKNISHYIPSESLVVFNNTKVIRARLNFFTETGARIEVFCLEPLAGKDISTAMTETGAVTWKCFVGNLKRFKQEKIYTRFNDLELSACKKGTDQDTILIEFEWNQSISFAEVLESVGQIPLPPYIKREIEEDDANTYQTVYAQHAGSVAAPTAGLHFTENVLGDLKKNHCRIEQITLHVGAATFKPVKADRMEGHIMHSEEIIIQKELLVSILDYYQRIVAVGTTTLRTLESLYWIGIKLILNEIKDDEGFFVSQWDPYEEKYQLKDKDYHHAISAIIAYLERKQEGMLIARTQIIIAPGYDFKIVNGLVTNFHQPRSTLLLLIAAFVGDSWAVIYEHALKSNYRFLSYGDSSYLERKKQKIF